MPKNEIISLRFCETNQNSYELAQYATAGRILNVLHSTTDSLKDIMESICNLPDNSELLSAVVEALDIANSMRNQANGKRILKIYFSLICSTNFKSYSLIVLLSACFVVSEYFYYISFR